jgi:hypothetical protein
MILQFFIVMERWIHRYGETRNYKIVIKKGDEGF